MPAPPNQPEPKPKVEGKPIHLVIVCFVVAIGVGVILFTAYGIWWGGWSGIVAAVIVAAAGFVAGHSAGIHRGLKIMAMKRVSLDPEKW